MRRVTSPRSDVDQTRGGRDRRDGPATPRPYRLRPVRGEQARAKHSRSHDVAPTQNRRHAKLGRWRARLPVMRLRATVNETNTESETEPLTETGSRSAR